MGCMRLSRGEGFAQLRNLRCAGLARRKWLRAIGFGDGCALLEGPENFEKLRVWGAAARRGLGEVRSQAEAEPGNEKPETEKSHYSALDREPSGEPPMGWVAGIGRAAVR